MFEGKERVRFNLSKRITYADIYTPCFHRTTIVIQKQVQFFFVIFIKPTLHALVAQVPLFYIQNSRGVHCTEHVRVYVSAQKGY